MKGFGERVMTWLPAEEEGALTSMNQMKTRAADGSSKGCKRYKGAEGGKGCQTQCRVRDLSEERKRTE